MYKLSCENTGEMTEGIKGNKGLEDWRKVDEGNILISEWKEGRKEGRKEGVSKGRTNKGVGKAIRKNGRKETEISKE
jgi:hypothetical protein